MKTIKNWPWAILQGWMSVGLPQSGACFSTACWVKCDCSGEWLKGSKKTGFGLMSSSEMDPRQTTWSYSLLCGGSGSKAWSSLSFYDFGFDLVFLALLASESVHLLVFVAAEEDISFGADQRPQFQRPTFDIAGRCWLRWILYIFWDAGLSWDLNKAAFGWIASISICSLDRALQRRRVETETANFL